MSLWEDFLDNASSAGEAIVDFLEWVEDGAENVEEITTGNLGDGLEHLGYYLSSITGGGRLGDFTSSAFSYIGGLVRGFGTLLSAFFTAPLKVIVGLIEGNWPKVWRAYSEFVQELVGFTLLNYANLIQVIQSPFLSDRFYKLNQEQLALLRIIYRDSIDYSLVRLIDGNGGLFSLNGQPGRAFVVANTIYTRRPQLLDTSGSPITLNTGILMHEILHVWQYQNLGGRYASQAFTAQFYYKSIGQFAYNWKAFYNPNWQRDSDSWDSFNREAQAEFVQDVYKYAIFRNLANIDVNLRNGPYTLLNTNGYDDEIEFFRHIYNINSNPNRDATDINGRNLNGVDLTDFTWNALETIRNGKHSRNQFLFS